MGYSLIFSCTVTVSCGSSVPALLVIKILLIMFIIWSGPAHALYEPPVLAETTVSSSKSCPKLPVNPKVNTGIRYLTACCVLHCMSCTDSSIVRPVLLLSKSVTPSARYISIFPVSSVPSAVRSVTASRIPSPLSVSPAYAICSSSASSFPFAFSSDIGTRPLLYTMASLKATTPNRSLLPQSLTRSSIVSNATLSESVCFMEPLTSIATTMSYFLYTADSSACRQTPSMHTTKMNTAQNSSFFIPFTCFSITVFHLSGLESKNWQTAG